MTNLFPNFGHGTLPAFRQHIAQREEVMHNDLDGYPGYKVFFPYVSFAETYIDMTLRECRGIVFDEETGACVSRPLHKFFNLGERDSTRVENLDWGMVVRVMDKRDGSMIHAFLDKNGEVGFKSKKTPKSDVSKVALDFAHKSQIGYIEFCHVCLGKGYTPIFEYTDPQFRIVLKYDEPQLSLLHVRNNHTGEYLTEDALRDAAKIYGVPVVDAAEIAKIPAKEDLGRFLLKAAETITGIEGWIVQFSNGEMVKVKTRWYLERHRAITFVRERDIAQLVLSEGVDDFKSSLTSMGESIAEIEKIEHRVRTILNSIRTDVDVLYESVKHLTGKDAVMALHGNKYQSLVMNRLNKKYDDGVVKYFTRNVLREEFSLDTISTVDTTKPVESFNNDE